MEDRAYGGVLLDHQGRVCLVRPVGRGLWALPKGHADPGEAPQAAALREVREESGFEARVEAFLGSVSYCFPLHRKGRDYSVSKVVEYWVMSLVDGVDHGHDHEMEAAAFFPLDEALEELGYPNERELLRAGRKLLKKIRRSLGSPDEAREGGGAGKR